MANIVIPVSDTSLVLGLIAVGIFAHLYWYVYDSNRKYRASILSRAGSTVGYFLDKCFNLFCAKQVSSAVNKQTSALSGLGDAFRSSSHGHAHAQAAPSQPSFWSLAVQGLPAILQHAYTIQQEQIKRQERKEDQERQDRKEQIERERQDKKEREERERKQAEQVKPEQAKAEQVKAEQAKAEQVKPKSI